METMTQDENELVYQAICAIAARCDGAVEQDGVGFSGQDTKFGRRIADIPFSEWTEDIKSEAARILMTYKAQSIAYTGIDPWSLEVVREAQGRSTNYKARTEARHAARRSELVEVYNRTLVEDVDHDGYYLVGWDKRDPDFNELLGAMRDLPGRSWNGSSWQVPLTRELAEFARSFEYKLTGAIARTFVAMLKMPAEKVYNVTLEGDHALVRAPYNPTLVSAIREVPGRSWDSGRSVNVVDLTPELLIFARNFGLSVHPDVEAAVAIAGSPKEEDPVPAMLAFASRCDDPAKLPEAFVSMVREALAR